MDYRAESQRLKRTVGTIFDPAMQDFLDAILDFIAVLFGDEPKRPPKPLPLPPGLPPATPPTPEADPDEPQDGADLKEGEDPVVVSHEDEIIPEGETPEFEEDPRPPPEEAPTGPDSGDPGAPIGDRDQLPLPPGGPARPPKPTHRARYMWCIDNGHGALTAGKRSPPFEGDLRLLEWEFNRDITRRIYARLDEIGVAYFDIVPETDIGNFLRERVDRANKLSSALPKLFVSVHGNAGPAPDLDSYTDDSVRGIETWHYHGSTRGRQLAAVFQHHLIEQTGMNNRHLRSKTSGQFYVLRATRMPAILTENGFYNNRFDLPIMLTDRFRELVAEAHVLAILEVEREGL